MAEAMGGFFVVVKYLAGAYLIWFGLSLLRAKRPTLAGTRDKKGKKGSVTNGSHLSPTPSSFNNLCALCASAPSALNLPNPNHPSGITFCACWSAWYEDRTIGPLATWLKPIA